MATQKFLFNLSICLPDAPVYGLVDSDPYGILIFMTYKFGSRKNAYCNHLLAVPRMLFLGVSLTDYTQGWTSLTSKDAKLSMTLLSDPWAGQPQFDCVRRELQLGLFLQKKAEMNISSKDGSRGVCQFVENQLIAANAKTEISTPNLLDEI